MLARRLDLLTRRAQRVAPGLIVSSVAAAAAMFLSAHYSAPAFLIALLLGMAMNPVGDHEPCRPGIDLATRGVLRIGVALLGVRITFGQIAALGWQPMVLVGVAVVSTIALSMAIARALGYQSLFGLLTGGATAICGASAALALAAALPDHPGKQRATLFTVIVVSLLSTAAMVLYPLIVHGLGLAPHAGGVFIGATIHDVAQVVGAGYAVSQETGDTATIVKLLRIGMLVPVILVAATLSRSRDRQDHTTIAPAVPWFAVAFVAVVLVNSTGLITKSMQHVGGELSRWSLLLALVAIGMRTQFKQLLSVGLKPVLLMIGETVFLAALVLVLIRWLA